MFWVILILLLGTTIPAVCKTITAIFNYKTAQTETQPSKVIDKAGPPRACLCLSKITCRFINLIFVSISSLIRNF